MESEVGTGLCHPVDWRDGIHPLVLLIEGVLPVDYTMVLYSYSEITVNIYV